MKTISQKKQDPSIPTSREFDPKTVPIYHAPGLADFNPFDGSARATMGDFLGATPPAGAPHICLSLFSNMDRWLGYRDGLAIAESIDSEVGHGWVIGVGGTKAIVGDASGETVYGVLVFGGGIKESQLNDMRGTWHRRLLIGAAHERLLDGAVVES